MALFVKNPAGVHVCFDGVLMPKPEQRTVNVLRTKDDTVIFSAHVDETMESSTISVEVKGENLPIALLDTKRAVTMPGSQRLPPGQRQVTIYVTDEHDYQSRGEACAHIVPAAGSGTFFVYYTAMQHEPAMTVFTKKGTSEVDRLADAQGETIAQSAASNGKSSVCSLWVKQGVDMAFVSCVCLAVQKLGTGQALAANWHSELLTPRRSSRPVDFDPRPRESFFR